MKHTPVIQFHYRGQIERGNGKPGYNWYAGYSETSSDGGVLYPWMTVRECQVQAKAQGAQAEFLNNGKPLLEAT